MKMLKQAKLVFKIFSGSTGPEALNVEVFRDYSRNALKAQVVRGFWFRILYLFFLFSSVEQQTQNLGEDFLGRWWPPYLSLCLLLRCVHPQTTSRLFESGNLHARTYQWSWLYLTQVSRIFFLVEVQLTYNIMLILGIQHSDSMFAHGKMLTIICLVAVCHLYKVNRILLTVFPILYNKHPSRFTHYYNIIIINSYYKCLHLNLLSPISPSSQTLSSGSHQSCLYLWVWILLICFGLFVGFHT